MCVFYSTWWCNKWPPPFKKNIKFLDPGPPREIWQGGTTLLGVPGDRLRFFSKLRIWGPIKPLVNFHKCFIFNTKGCVLACAQYSDFLDRSQLLTQTLLKQGYVAPRLKSSIQKFYDRHHNLVDRYKISISNDNGSFTFYLDIFFPLSLPRYLHMSNTSGVL